MLKHTVALIIVSAFAAGSTFAHPTHLFVKDHLKKSSSPENHYAQTSPSKFTGTWTGMCGSDQGNHEVKFIIAEDEYDFKVEIVHQQGTDMVEAFSFNEIKSETHTGGFGYDSSTSKLTRVDANTLRLDNSYAYSDQVPSSSDENTEFRSGVNTVTFVVNNNQLNIDIKSAEFGNQNTSTEDKCVLKRTG